MKLAACFFGLLMVTATFPAGAGERLAIRVSPAVAFAPANLIIQAIVESDPENRAMQISAESNDFYRSSEIPLDGDKAPRVSRLEFRNLPSGSYEVKATLLDSVGHKRAHVRQQVNIIVSGADPGRR